MKRTKLTVYKEKALLISTVPPGRAPRINYSLEELTQLTRTAGAIVLKELTQKKDRPDAAYYIGRGKVQEIREFVDELDIDVVIFDNNLSPAQIRNLEKELGTKVIDRTELILDIFATHARTRQAKLQVELAQLEYALPRLKRLWTHLSRIEGGIGIGQRGPGEAQLEIDRRLARDRITRLKRELGRIRAHRARETSARVENFTICLVGYTNAGKSTLMNALTNTDLYVDNRLFSTLDTKTHIWELPRHHKVLLSDTVGFIKNLPHHLVFSFHATLQEATQANLLLHLVDASHPEAVSQIEAVNRVLEEIGCGDKQVLLVFNKVDKADPMELAILRSRGVRTDASTKSVTISALTGQGLEDLEHKVEEFIQRQQLEMSLLVPAGHGKLLAYLEEKGGILDKVYEDSSVRLRVRLGPRDAAKVKEQGAKVIERAETKSRSPHPAKREEAGNNG